MNRLQANIVLLLVAIIWGSTFVVQQVGTGGLGAITCTSARFFMGTSEHFFTEPKEDRAKLFLKQVL